MRLLWLRQSVLLLSVVLAASLLGLTLAVWQGARATLDALTDVVGRYTWMVMQRDIAGVQPAGLPVARVAELRQQTGASRVGLATEQIKSLGGFGYPYQGVNRDFFAVRRFGLRQGRLFEKRSEVVVGASLADRLGQQIEVGFGTYTVVGVLAPLAQRNEEDTTIDGTAFVPLEGYAGLDSTVRVLYLETTPERFAGARGTLERWLGPLGRRYQVETLAEQYGFRLREKVSRLLGSALGLAALSTLLVALLNLYTFFVARALERVRATGVRRAVGATRRQLLSEEFLYTSPWMVGGFVLSLPVIWALCEAARHFYGLPARLDAVGVLAVFAAIAVMVGLATLLAQRPFLLRPPVNALKGGVRHSLGGSFWLSAIGLVLGLGVFVLQASVGRSAVRETARLTGQMGPRTAWYNPQFLGQAGFADRRGQVELKRSRYLALKNSELGRSLAGVAFVMAPFDTLTGPLDSRFTTVRIIEGDYTRIVPVAYLAGRAPQPGRSEVVLGNRLAVALYGRVEAALNQPLQVLGEPYRVVGVFEGANPMGVGAREDQAMVWAEDANVSEAGAIWVQVRPDQAVAATLEGVTRFLNERYGRPDLRPVVALQAKDFSSDLVTALSQLEQVYGALSGVLLTLGALGLGLQRFSVGLARVQEVGVRRAVGGLSRHIFVLFLSEAARLSLGAGVLGIGLGVALSFLVARAQNTVWVLDGYAVLAALAAAVLLGVLAAALPAGWASRRPPLEALRERP